MYVDVHSHLTRINYEAAIKKYQGISARIVANGLNPETNEFAVKLSEQYDFIECANGIHPTEIESLTEPEIQSELEKIRNREKDLSAIGEIGLDYKIIPNSRREFHKKIFIEQLKIAKKMRKPVIVHSRYAEEHVIDLIKANFNGKVILHSFTGSVETAKLLGKKFYFGVNPLVFRNENMRKIVEFAKLSQIITETDFPYVCKSPHELVDVVSEIAKIKNEKPKAVVNQMFSNYNKIFGRSIFLRIREAIQRRKERFKGISSPFHSGKSYKKLFSEKPKI